MAERVISTHTSATITGLPFGAIWDLCGSEGRGGPGSSADDKTAVLVDELRFPW